MTWFIAGILVGGAVAGLAWLKLAPGPKPSSTAVATAPIPAAPPQPAESPPVKPPAEPIKAPTEAPPAEPVSEAPPPRFEYYSVLPEMEVVIPPDELKSGTQAKPPPQTVAVEEDVPASPASPVEPTAATPSVAAGDAVYLLQLGSFRRTEEADRLKASLGLLGITARIEKVTIDDKGTYYRVRSGPYSKDQVYSLHGRLKENRVDSQIIRVKN